MELKDGYGRVHDDLRISVTDRCNLRCTYCMPEEPDWFPRDEILTYEELLRIVRITLRRGVRKLRLTGGEPLVRRDLARFVSLLADQPEVEDLSLTTNALLLPQTALDLAAAGLRRINVSLDTLDGEQFRKISRRDALQGTLRGLEAASAAGLRPIKINAVLVRDLNDHEAEDLAGRARDNGWELRFIEYMPLDNSGTWDPERVVSGDELRRRIHARWPLEREPNGDPNAPATRWLYRDGRGAIGFINSVHEPFCSTCSRLRLTADGHFRVCLYDPAEVDLKTPMRNGATDADLDAMIMRAVKAKDRGGALQILERRAALPLNRTMHQIGG